jgi:iron complex transport system ATP-binding protein
LLDEPTSHLDLGNARRVLRVLRSLGQEGRTIVLTTHDPNAATAIATDVLLMRQGRVIAHGPVDEVMTSEQLSATYDVPVQVIRVQGRPLVLAHESF